MFLFLCYNLIGDSMKKIITNKHNLKDEDITEVVKRVKVLLINSNNEILLANSNHEYQFPGGHVEDGEELIDTVNREITEETGLVLNAKDIEPFACSMGYWKDWPEEGKNRKTEIYYFEVKTDLKPDLNNINLTDKEKEGNFHLEYLSLDSIEEIITNNANTYEDKHGIAKEMLELFSIYKKGE